MNRPRLSLFALQQLRDQVGAEHEKQADPKRAGDAKRIEESVGRIQAVMQKNEKEGEEAKNVKLWTIETDIFCSQRFLGSLTKPQGESEALSWQHSMMNQRPLPNEKQVAP